MSDLLKTKMSDGWRHFANSREIVYFDDFSDKIPLEITEHFRSLLEQ